MSRLFGTDGVRGLANETLTVELSVQLAQAASPVLGAEAFDAGRRPVAVVARDPRISGEFIAAAVQAGLASSGVDVWDAGVLPTPAAAYLVGDLDADFGVMISASHNPAPDNGIKFLARGGEKLTDAQEDEIIRHLEGVTPRRPQGADVGRVRVFADAEDRYVLHLLQTLPHRLDGLKVVLDCAHGAAAGCSPEAFRAAGAEVVVIGASPDGLNINDGYGSTHHTTTPNVTDGSREAAESIAQVVQNAHMGSANDWGDTGQHFTVSRGGFAMEGRHGSRHALEGGQTFMLGVHALGFNAYALGIECEGLYMLNPPPQSLYAGLVPLVAYICQQYELPPSRIIGHRDVTATSCCGDAFYAKLPILREDVRLSLASGEYHVSEGFGADNLFDDAHVTPEYVEEERG